MTPFQVWEDYDAELLELKTTLQSKEYRYDKERSTFIYNALQAEDGAVKVVVRVVNKAEHLNKVVLIVQEYHESVQEEVINDLADKGYIVVIPDYSGLGKEIPTRFPPSLDYGNIERAGEHIKKVCPTAKETNQYLYSIIMKRAITFINKELGITEDIILLGIGQATEVAMQVAGSDNRIKALALINGFGYKEYSHLNKYGEKQELKIDSQLMSWLTGVAAVAYAKHIAIPVLIAISSNGRQADIDRLPNLMGLLKEKQARVIITPRSSDSINNQTYIAITKWLKEVFDNNRIPEKPKTTLRVSDGIIYAEVDLDRTKEVEEVNLYYSYGEYDHLVRNWRKIKCNAISKEQFLAKLDIGITEGPLFAFCKVVYEDGFVLSSLEDYEELGKYDLKKTIDNSNTRIVYEGYMGKASFSEESEQAILLQSGLTVAVTPLGLKGVMSRYGQLLSYEIGTNSSYNSGRILQIDAYSSKDIMLEIKLIIKKEEFVEEYIAKSSMKVGSGAFISHKFDSTDFKNNQMKALDDWSNVKAIKIANKDVIIGKIIYI